MTTLSKDEIIAWAREAGATPYTNRHYPENPHNTFGLEQLEKFAHLCRADLVAERDALKADAERYRWLTVNAYVGIAPHPKPHEVWCLRLPNPSYCNNLDAAIDAAMKRGEA